MKYTVILLATLGLMLCALSAGCTSPTQAEIKPAETTSPTLVPVTSASTSTATVVSTPVCGRNPSHRTKYQYPCRKRTS